MTERKYPISLVFWIVRDKTHSVEVKAWASRNLEGGEQWHWNVYGHIFETHSLFGKPQALRNMPLHWGASFDEFSTSRPAFGIEYDWQKERKTYTFGSDYSHYGDPEDHPSPFDGIPWYVERDALELAEWLKEEGGADKLVETRCDGYAP